MRPLGVNFLSEFIRALLSQPFLQNALVTGMLASFACGVVGTYVVVKKIGYISGGIAHAVLGGMGVAYFLGADPIHGAIVAALLAAIIIGIVSIRVHQHEDTVIGAIWAIGMAIGVIFISRTPGYNVDLMSYLFGNILMVTKSNILTIALLNVGILAVVMLYYKQFTAVCFDEEYASLQGVNVTFIYILLLCIIAITVVILIQVVGLILVIALLTLPAAIAGHYAKRLVKMMVLASVLGMVFTILGLAVSYSPNLPAGATIILIAGFSYLLSFTIKGFLSRRLSRQVRKESSSTHE